MKLSLAVWLVGCAFLARSGVAGPVTPPEQNPNDASNPYAVISDRNVFHLNPLPTIPDPEPPKLDLPVVKLTGFFRVSHTTKAFFCAMPKDKKDPPSYYTLCEGEKKDFLEVVKIRYDKGEVDVVNSGSPETLNLKDDSLAAKQETAPNNPGPTPAVVGRPFHAGFEPPGGRREVSRHGANSPFAFPTRPLRGPAPP